MNCNAISGSTKLQTLNEKDAARKALNIRRQMDLLSEIESLA